MAFSPDGKQVLTLDRPGGARAAGSSAQLWEAASGKEIRAFQHASSRSNNRGVSFAALSQDGKRVLTDGSDNTVRLWGVASGEQIRAFPYTFRFASKRPLCSAAAFSHDGKHVLTPYADTVRLWDTDSGKDIHVFKADDYQLTCAALSPDGKHVLTGSENGTARIWSIASGKKCAGCSPSLTAPGPWRRRTTTTWPPRVR